uniref:Heat shock protein 60 n=1 Tax=Eucampia antarctica TaxID=49252 RepID=A0A7S2WK37_9STRA|mmetsp:Transcript_3949/g.3707  ORF Transcript_3949/g.3707 Transcript_3949/m.3707 type:complete len:578 (+) Transcript_3949:76-1809(+)|eukprot:CAMPEP_0197829270 /NCGR_PEP_ID=MMETSP1437-20131217/5680_1 /TAXON_ID=49252 ORGANISM="Eucampia antarctica, Strain CCMP1452" /NCGR_SAMPLE_ID=MMETSP1437 /ASSEMBLY_ACC=CAM_ASM_001096 /LENGTH=577 /DNA_ID=CAMNT_0043430823 /DNA_START=54 /DNA_END=1787 /DNA_ORIENTATION=+
MMQSALKKSSAAAKIATEALGSTRCMSGKEIKFGTEGRAAMLAGVDLLADAVQVTLGPKGRNAIIAQPYGAPKITKDGVTVAKAIDFEDNFENMGAQLVKSVASKTNDTAGDGTTTATILARAIYSEGCKAVAAGMNPLDLRRGIQKAVNSVVDTLGEISRPITTKEEVMQVGTISANADTEIGQLIADAMERVGKEGVITVQDGKTLENELEVVEGMKFERGFISPYFITDPKTQTVELENPMILLVEKKVSSLQQIVPLLESVIKSNSSLLIVAEDVESEALAALVVNKLRAGIKVCAVKAPGFGDNRKATMQDLAILTGGTVISEDIGLKLEEVQPAQLGSCKRLTVTKNDTVVLDGAGDNSAIEERCDFIRASIESTKSDYEREKLQERLAKLSGGVAVIKVGGASEVEVNEKKDRVVDALNATRAAVEEGIVPGGGKALLYASTLLKGVADKCDNMDQRIGVEIIERALRAPLKTIAMNAGEEGAVICGKLLEEGVSVEQGFDAQNGVYTNMFEAGIIDPTKVTRTGIVDAASVAGLLTTSEAMIADKPMEGGGPAGPPPGMGGMGGMGGMM